MVYTGDDEVQTRLVTLNNDAERVKFATLSHCWGSQIPLRVNAENIHELSRRIPTEALPRTFQEAADICRFLKIPYIWIDSLCIVQDDAADWRREAARMKDVYAGSTLTIAASEATNGLEGCFSDRWKCNPQKLEPAQFVVCEEQGNEAFARVYNGNLTDRVAQTPLSDRGWVLQEELLSYRTLYCTGPEMHWRCHRLHRTEDGAVFERSKSKTSTVEPLPAGLSFSSASNPWLAWMQDYSHRKFTVPQDRLSALAGMVQQFEEFSGYTHLLGCWRESLITELLWMRTGRDTSHSFPLPGIPSWSWLSLANITFDFWGNDPTGEVLEVEVEDHSAVAEAVVEWEGVPLLSNIKHTRLILEGPTQELTLRVPPEGLLNVPPYFDVGEEVVDGSKSLSSRRCAARFDSDIENASGIYTCILIRTTRFEERSDRKTSETFLILAPKGGDTYHRIGIGALYKDDPKASGFQDAIRRRISII
ncbi:hypothetical protein HJFPF1_02696 [Paramyrothecium foliicola]|nr:hypothetical protein HJFPF1_02696 [Paramyrothecium foliicola]